MNPLRICIRYECRKLASRRNILLFALCFAVHLLLCLFSTPKFYSITYDPAVCRAYVQQFAGVCTEQTIAAIDEETARQREIAEAPAPPLQTAAEAEKQSRNAMIAQKKIVVLGVLRAEAERLTASQIEGAMLVYSAELDEYCRQFRWNFPLLLCLALMTVSVMLSDTRSGMYRVLYPSKIGKAAILRGKIAAVTMISFAASILFSIMQTALIAWHWDLGSLSAPLHSHAAFAGCGLAVSCGTALLLDVLLRVLGSVITALLLAAVTHISKSEVLSLCIVVLLIGAGAFFAPNAAWLPSSLLQDIAGLR